MEPGLTQTLRNAVLATAKQKSRPIRGGFANDHEPYAAVSSWVEGGWKGSS